MKDFFLFWFPLLLYARRRKISVRRRKNRMKNQIEFLKNDKKKEGKTTGSVTYCRIRIIVKFGTDTNYSYFFFFTFL